MLLNKMITFSNKTDGRDKFCKMVQYGSRLIKYIVQNDKDLAARFGGLQSGMANARKLFRLFKTLNEVQTLLDIFSKKNDDQIELILKLVQRFGFALYWIFDNLVILCTIKFLKKEAKPFNKTGSLFWFIALLAGIVQAVRNLIRCSHKELTCQQAINRDPDNQENKVKLGAIQKEKFTNTLNLIKCIADSITAGQNSEIWPKLIKKNANDGLCGLGGFTSAALASYQQW